MYDVETLYHIATKVDALFQNFKKLNLKIEWFFFEICGIVDHVAVEWQVKMSANGGMGVSKLIIITILKEGTIFPILTIKGSGIIQNFPTKILPLI